MKRSNDKPGKLNLKRETLRRLQLVVLSDDNLRQVAGGRWGTSGDCNDGISVQTQC